MESFPPVLHAGYTLGKAAMLLQLWTDVTAFALVDSKGYLIGEVARSQLLKVVERYPSLLRGSIGGARVDDSVDGARTCVEYLDTAKGGGIVEGIVGERDALGGDVVQVTTDTSPMQIMHLTVIERIDVLVRMLRLDHLWVVRRGVLIGVVTKESMMENVPKNRSAFDVMRDLVLNKEGLDDGLIVGGGREMTASLLQ
jgi:hypothetical protein